MKCSYRFLCSTCGELGSVLCMGWGGGGVEVGRGKGREKEKGREMTVFNAYLSTQHTQP